MDQAIKNILDMLTSVRPDGIEPDAYPMVVEMIYNYSLLQLTGQTEEVGK